MLVYALQIITIVISIVSLIINFYIAKSEIKKKLFSETIVKQRISDLNNIRIDSANFYSYVDLNVIKNQKNNIEYIKLVAFSKNKLISNFKVEYKEDVQIIDLINKIYSYAYDFVIKDKIDEKLYEELCKKLYILISKYNSANWSCIKKQAYGVEYFNEDFVKYFYEMEIKNI